MGQGGTRALLPYAHAPLRCGCARALLPDAAPALRQAVWLGHLGACGVKTLRSLVRGGVGEDPNEPKLDLTSSFPSFLNMQGAYAPLD